MQLSNAQAERLTDAALAAGELAKGTAEVVAEMGHRLVAVEQMVAMNPDVGTSRPVPRDQVAAAIVNHPEIAKFAAQAAAGELPAAVRVSVPVLANDISGAPGSAGALRTPHNVPGIVPLGRVQPRVADLFRKFRATSNSVIFLRQLSDTNGAAPVAELAGKPETAMTYAEIEAPIVTLAHWARCSKQIISDVPMLQNFISRNLLDGLADLRERQILLGSGVGDNLHGIIPQAAAAEMQGVLGDASATFRGITVQSPTRLDVLKVAALQVELDSGIVADAVVLHPADVAAIRAMKLTDGRYVTQAPSLEPGAQAPGINGEITHIFGMRVVQSVAVEPGEFLVGSFQHGGALYVRDEASVELGYAGDDFTENAIRILCEERIALPVWQLSCFVTGQF